MFQRLADRINLTAVIVGVNAVVFIIGSISARTVWPDRVTEFQFDYGIVVASVAYNGEWWRLFTGAFVHSSLPHLAFNMFLLWLLGRPLEELLGKARFFFLYIVSLTAGSMGVALLADPISDVTVGASGAVLGLVGGALVMHRLFAGRLNISALVLLLGVNLLLTFSIPNISVGGHLGGIVGGAVIGFFYLSVYRMSQRLYFSLLYQPGSALSPDELLRKCHRREVRNSCILGALMALLFFVTAFLLAEIAWANVSEFLRAFHILRTGGSIAPPIAPPPATA